LRLYLAGYPWTRELKLTLENLELRQQLPLQVPRLPRESWQLSNFPLPREWKGQPVRLLAEDESKGPGGWIAFAEVPPIRLSAEISFAFRLLGLTLFVFVVTTLPAAAACMLAAWRGVRNALDLTAIALLAMTSAGYLAFWIYFINPVAGNVFRNVVLIACIAFIAWAVSRGRGRIDWQPLRQMIVPLLVLALASVFVISLGFVYGEPMSVQDYSAQRFGPPALSIDNFLPKLLADAVYQHHIAIPFISDWLSSDRPPLQAGMALWTYGGMHPNRDLNYELLGVILQLTALVGLWAYLEASQVSRKAVALILVATLFSGFTIFNSFFTWPKLFPAALLLLIPAYLLTARYRSARSDWRVGVIVGAAIAFAMLCHGGSAFGIIGLALALAVLRRLPSLRFTAAAVIVAGLLYLPWMLYQKYYDPPGDRLLKMHLAGVLEPRPEASLRQILAEKYGKLSWQQIADYKLDNFRSVFDTKPFWSHGAVLVRGLLTGNAEESSAAAAFMRVTAFYRWNRSIDVFSFAPLAFLLFAFRRRKSIELQQAWFLWLSTAIILVVWCLLMYGPYSTVVHQGCYLTEVTAITGGVLVLWALSPKLAACLAALHIAFNLALYVFLNPSKPVGVATFMGPRNPVLDSFAVLSAAAFVFCLWRMGHAGAVEERKAAIALAGAQPEYAALS
jgi:hypothetical protein